MKYVFGYAGIPQEIYDEVYKSRSTFTAGGIEFEGASLAYGHNLDANQGVRILKKLKERVVKEKNTLEEISYGVICVRPPGSNISNFEKVFFPNTFVISVEWELLRGDKALMQQSKNALVQALRGASLKLRGILIALRKELKERANRTPLLLPLKNFRSKILSNHLYLLQAQLCLSDDPFKTIQKAVKEFEHLYPMQKVDNKSRPCFIDDVKVEFHSPGSALHGLSKPGGDHLDECVLNGVRRLGAQFHPAFHYDCEKGTRLRGLFHHCHSVQASQQEGDPHINIAPNDFIRI